MADMNEIRGKVLDRIDYMVRARAELRSAIESINTAEAALMDAWEGWTEPYQRHHGMTALRYFVVQENKQLDSDLAAAIHQFAGLFVRDVITPELRASDKPVVALTSNTYMPPIRDYGEVERLWQMDESDLFELFMESFEQKVNEANLIIGSPDFDNMLYGVDGNKWTWGVEHTDDPNDWLDNEKWTVVRD